VDIKMIVAENVRKRRRKKGLSQEKLAKRAGISAKCLSQIENRHNTTLAIVQKIANALEVEPSLLFYVERAVALPRLSDAQKS
jgi:transcriptional regulator with XRE-family HTH domain